MSSGKSGELEKSFTKRWFFCCIIIQAHK